VATIMDRRPLLDSPTAMPAGGFEVDRADVLIPFDDFGAACEQPIIRTLPESRL
jgi:hypothetical protein